MQNIETSKFLQGIIINLTFVVLIRCTLPPWPQVFFQIENRSKFFSLGPLWYGLQKKKLSAKFFFEIFGNKCKTLFSKMSERKKFGR